MTAYFQLRPLLFVLVILFTLGHTCEVSLAMKRTIKKDPAIVMVAFGTTTKARVTYDFFDEQLRNSLPEKYRHLQIQWAFTSEIIRELANKKFAQAGAAKRYKSLAQVFADLEDEGYRKIVLQSLHIFPGQEYEEMLEVIEAFESLGLHIEYGGSLFHSWDQVFETITALESQFLAPEQGCNILVAHGTPETYPGSNSTYLGIARYLEHKYPNVFVGGVDGVLTREQALDAARKYPREKVRLIPLMFVAGDHVMKDIMGSEPDRHGEYSWMLELQRDGVAVESVKTIYQEKQYYKGLGFYPEINRIFLRQVMKNLEKLKLD